MAMTRAPYLDAGLTIEARVEDLLARMTVEEKVAQLGSIWSFEVVRDGALDLDRSRALLGAGLGQVTRVAGGTNLDALEVAAAGNEIQRFLVEGVDRSCGRRRRR